MRPWRVISRPERELLFSPRLYSTFPAGNRISSYYDTVRSVPGRTYMSWILARLANFLSQLDTNRSLARPCKISAGPGRDVVDTATLPSAFLARDRLEGKCETARSRPSWNVTSWVAQPSKVLSQPKRRLLYSRALQDIFPTGE